MNTRKESRSCWLLPSKGKINLSINSEDCKGMDTSVKESTGNVLYFNS